MKQNRIFTVSVIIILSTNAFADDTNEAVKTKDMMASLQNNYLPTVERTISDFSSERQQMIADLLNVFKDAKSSNLSQCAAGYCLGEIRASEAADTLASKITLELDLSKYPIDHFPICAGTPILQALVKIGNPSFPAVIRNLEESDDIQVRDLSLKVLYRIDGDKDIVQLRLQKALKAEKDPQKQARIQAAIKSLRESRSPY
jgi:hypothetical protein